jgi:glycerol uptake facilitator-like aquaporin
LLSLNWATTTPIDKNTFDDESDSHFQSILISRQKYEVSYNPFSVSTSFLTSMIIFGPVSGGHFNPAITLGVMIKEMNLKGISWTTILMTIAIIFSQILGGFLGVFISYLSISDGGET